MPDLGNIVEKATSGAASLLFSDKDLLFAYNNQSLIVRVGEGTNVLTFPLQPRIEVRLHRNWVLTEVAGSGADPDLRGATVKENMGLSDARITIEGYLMSSDPPGLGLIAPTTGVGQYGAIAQTFGNSESGVMEARRWIEQLKEIKATFDEEGPLRILAATPDGDNLFEPLGITHVLPLSLTISERLGFDMKAYTFYLIQDRVIEIEKLLPTEEGEGE